MNNFNVSVNRGFSPDSSSFEFSVNADRIVEIFNNQFLAGNPSFIRFETGETVFQITFDWTCFIEVQE